VSLLLLWSVSHASAARAVGILTLLSPYQHKEQQRVTIDLVVDNHSVSRGGFNLAATTAKVATAFWGLNGGLLLVNPMAFFKQVYKLESPAADGGDDDAELSSNVMRAIGSISVGTAITVYSSIVQQQLSPKAVGLACCHGSDVFFGRWPFFSARPSWLSILFFPRGVPFRY
jgi:hypothetical protein